MRPARSGALRLGVTLAVASCAAGLIGCSDGESGSDPAAGVYLRFEPENLPGGALAANDHEGRAFEAGVEALRILSSSSEDDGEPFRSWVLDDPTGLLGAAFEAVVVEKIGLILDVEGPGTGAGAAPDGDAWQPMPWFGAASDGSMLFDQVLRWTLEDAPIRTAKAALLIDYTIARILLEQGNRESVFWDECVEARLMIAGFLGGAAADQRESTAGLEGRAGVLRRYSEAVRFWHEKAYGTGERVFYPLIPGHNPIY